MIWPVNQRRVIRWTTGLLVLALAASAPAQERPRHEGSPSAAKGRAAAARSRDTATTWHARHGAYFERNWGIDVVGVRRVSSGVMLRFDYRVVDPDRAAALTRREARPYIVDEATNTALAVPAMENIGELRQIAPLERHRQYFIVFGNPGGLVKRGGRVTLVVGNFRAEGLVVD